MAERSTLQLLLIIPLLLIAACSAPPEAQVVSIPAPVAGGGQLPGGLPTVAPAAPRPLLPTATAPLPTATVTASPTIAATATSEPPTATPSGPTAIVTPSPRPVGTLPRVGLQVGHLNASELPEELARFRNSTGAQWGGVTEAELNLEVVQRVKALLEAEGVVVDLLPATIPPAYDADAFLSIHADGNAGTAARGWKLATPWRASKASLQLMEAVAATYGAATGMPEDVGGVTVNMRGYYAFNFRRHVYSVARTTPAIIVEMGFMTNAADRAILFNEPQRVARGIAEGVLNYLRQRDPNDGAALLPPDFPTMRARPGGAILRSAPSDEARVVAEVSGEGRVFVFLREENWYQVMVRIGEERLLGWILVEQVEEAPALTPTAVP